MRCHGFEKNKTKLAREKTFISCPFDLHQEYVCTSGFLSNLLLARDSPCLSHITVIVFPSPLHSLHSTRRDHFTMVWSAHNHDQSSFKYILLLFCLRF